MNAHLEIEPRVLVEIADASDLMLEGQEEADLALMRVRSDLEDVALALHGREHLRRHCRDTLVETGEAFLRLARAM